MRHLALAASLVTLACGCGTWANMRGSEIIPPPHGMGRLGTPPQSIYGGVCFDAMYGSGLFYRASEDFCAIPAGLYTLLIDLPLSAVGDTLTLPWTIHASINRAVEAHAYPGPDGCDPED